jgi:hypothetical protein
LIYQLKLLSSLPVAEIFLEISIQENVIVPGFVTSALTAELGDAIEKKILTTIPLGMQLLLHLHVASSAVTKYSLIANFNVFSFSLLFFTPFDHMC